ncbi:hypothetical protein TNIN_309291 [Trichonephila inaurata madagascariensis]|uniref:Uncharacterized protein n=1 Tax=Trichonephila inaurata madagascariensis TaxID=2747483 RepID=A0A8X6WWE4_9ARAC|nr:hypothetical protein TNIN_309291 [Trichonephila inaurata madagascariensis]
MFYIGSSSKCAHARHADFSAHSDVIKCTVIVMYGVLAIDVQQFLGTAVAVKVLSSSSTFRGLIIQPLKICQKTLSFIPWIVNKVELIDSDAAMFECGCGSSIDSINSSTK